MTNSMPRKPEGPPKQQEGDGYDDDDIDNGPDISTGIENENITSRRSEKHLDDKGIDVEMVYGEDEPVDNYYDENRSMQKGNEGTRYACRNLT